MTFLAGCTRETANAKNETTAVAPALSVRTVRLDARPIEQRVEVTGTLVSVDAVEVKSEVQGRLISVLKEEGDYVRQGELLVQLDDSNAKLGVQQAEANVGAIAAALERVQVAEEHARIEEERAKNLIESGGITDRDFQAAQMALKDTRAQLHLIEAQIEQAKQALATAQKRLSDCRVYSPISGEVERKYQNRGTYVDGNTVLLRIVDNQRLELESYVAADELGRLKEGQELRFNVSSYPEAFEARVTTISPAVQSVNRSVRIRASVPNPQRKLKAGMFGRGWIVTGIKPEGFLVPPNAIWRRPKQAPFVYVVENNVAHKREVGVGLDQTEGIEITQGVKAGELVVIEQYLELADGSRVSPLS